MAWFQEPLRASLRQIAAPLALAASVLSAAALTAAPARAELASCLSPDPSQWPAASKPYFMLVVDTSGSMGTAIAGSTNSCNYQNNRIGHARCAVKNTVQAFAGEVNFGLATYAWRETNCSNATCGNCDQNSGCFAQCTAQYGPNDDAACGAPTFDPAFYGGIPGIHSGGYVVTPMLQDHYWFTPPDASNVPGIVNLVDNNCGNNEIGANSNTPLGGSLYDMKRYFSGTYVDPFTNLPVASPIGPATFNNQPAERPCRSVNIILITDGDETCDGYIDTGTYPTIVNGELLPALEAQHLLNGVSVDGQTFSIKTHVIGFVGATKAALDNIALFGGTGSAYSTGNETQLAQALANIISSAIKPEICDNTDNNCNGCTDEGSKHYCDVQNMVGCCTWTTTAQRTACGANACKCCTWTSAAERTTCLGNYTATITAANPQGNVALLPCTTPAQVQPATWLCYDPTDTCDNLDNNCVAGVDESSVKCGNPLHCPVAEACNGQDDDCDGLVDEGCPQVCNSSPEICDGCDNDCDGMTDDGVASIPCGIPAGPTTPANCAGVLTCKAPQAVSPGACAPGGGFNACNNNPLPETCDLFDNNCNGIVDDGIPSIPCVPAGQPNNLNYGVNSQCKMGQTVCTNGVTVCQGFIGPSTEICDGKDNDCDGQVDEQASGVGQACGINQPPCVPGTTACVNGALICQGGIGPKPETCNGLDDNCNGVVDDAPLADGPAPGMNGCWVGGGNCCSFPVVSPTLFWCAPPGAMCNVVGSLTAPCNTGTLACQGGAWSCNNAKLPGTEVCNGVDDDCDGQIDEGNLPGVGQGCGPATPPCVPGVKACVAGIIVCQGGTQPTAEICDGIDNDCNGTVDDGIAVGGVCTIAYDPLLYPGDRSHAPCQPGVLQCDGQGGTICLGGVGPAPEVCDGIDNDCDGQIDEVGNPPDGLNGTQNPLPPPAAAIGDVCGSMQGECKEGTYACVNGTFACVGGQSSVPETCDCNDNDCDGQVDNPNGVVPICSPGKDCVASTFGCQCAEPCDITKEFPCPGGQTCQEVTSSQTGQVLGNYCVSDPCGDCTTKTVKDPATSKVICAPAGAAADPATCVTPPVCACKGQSGCKDPCFGVTCPVGQACKKAGSGAGTCVVESCFENPCPGCDKVCDLGSCIDNPCTPTSCQPDEQCKPNADFLGFVCITPCADQACPGQICVNGMCVNDCAPPCDPGQICDTTLPTPACVPDKCNPSPCTDGSCCNPLTGSCGNCPCEGVICPAGDECKNGDCVKQMASSSASSSSGSGGQGGSSTSAASGAGSGGADTSIWGLATGGGGCACEVGPGLADLADGRWILGALAIAAARRRRRARGQAEGEVVS